MRAAVFLALKDLRLLMRDRAAAFFTFVFPLAIALFFGYVFSGTTSEPLRVAAFVEQSSPAATMLIKALDAGDDYNRQRMTYEPWVELIVENGGSQ